MHVPRHRSPFVLKARPTGANIKNSKRMYNDTRKKNICYNEISNAKRRFRIRCSIQLQFAQQTSDINEKPLAFLQKHSFPELWFQLWMYQKLCTIYLSVRKRKKKRSNRWCFQWTLFHAPFPVPDCSNI